MDTTSLILSSVLILIPLYISHKEHLGLEKEIIISMIRAVVQLIIVGYLLDLIFGVESPIVTVILVLIMIINAAVNTKKRGGKINNVIPISFIAMTIGTSLTITILVLSGSIKFIASEIVPISGMIVSNAMVAIGLSYRSLNNEFKNRRAEVEVKLSLGADIKESSRDILRESIKLAVIPTIDSAKTLGIVSLPGMMTGLILGGTSPLVAVKFQIMVTFMILSSSSLATLTATYLCYKDFFNRRMQLR